MDFIGVAFCPLVALARADIAEVGRARHTDCMAAESRAKIWRSLLIPNNDAVVTPNYRSPLPLYANLT
jgi:hypothetical protein